MARSFTSKETRQLIEEHIRLKRQLENAEEIAAQYRSEMVSASDKLIAQEVLEILKEIPIEEVNRDKRGFRTKVLRDYGYLTLSDLATVSVDYIASLRGVSEDAAYAMKQVVDELASETRAGAKIRLSSDDKTPSATQLVAVVSKYRKSIPYIENCQRLLSLNGKKIESALQDLAPAASGLRCFFTSRRNKQKAQEAYDLLKFLRSDGYDSEVERTITALHDVRNTTDSDAWSDFCENSIQFFNVLEDVVPGILGTSDAVYGLPEDLAREIQDESFFTEGLLCKLRRYQEWGVKYVLHQKRVLLGDEMGLGKTIQAMPCIMECG